MNREGNKVEFGNVLAALREEAGSESEKGTLFERLMVAVLKQSPDREIKDVWRWSDWPDRGKISGKNAQDTGIDLVAQMNDGTYQAIQCKFYAPESTLQKSDIDSFFTASGKEWVSSRLIISTTDNWSKHAEDSLKDQQIDIQRYMFRDLEKEPIDWDLVNPLNTKIRPPKKKNLFARQKEALKAVIKGFQSHDERGKPINRGKLIMACGTGKTLTSLHIAEKQVPKNGRILFLVPSISLLSQTLHEWAWERRQAHRYLAVCSDSHVGHNEEDVRISDLSIPATTNAHRISAKLKQDFEGLTIVFSTYHSLERVHAAQVMGAPDFDLVICDEAHRTTGVEGSQFTKIHDSAFIKATKRLYMTATPRIYADTAKQKAKESDIDIYSMDDEKIYGEQFYRLDFSLAVSEGLLSDYRVLVLAIDEKYISRNFQTEMSDGSKLSLSDAAKIVGCYKALRDQGQKEGGKHLKRGCFVFEIDQGFKDNHG